MNNHLTWRERLTNRFYAIPAVAQWWATRSAGRTQQLVDLSNGIPFARFTKALARSRVALVTTAGVHLKSQPPFDMVNPEGDATFRELPDTSARADMMITHKYYDHGDADRDLNVVFPLAHFHDLAQHGVIAELATRHFSFMGHIDAGQVAVLNDQTAPAMAAQLRRDGVDCAFLTPA